MFDNPYGTGQTTLTALLALTNVLAAGREFCIVGYGWVGKGLARAARRARRPRHRRRDRPCARADRAHGRPSRRRARRRAARRRRRDHRDRSCRGGRRRGARAAQGRRRPRRTPATTIARSTCPRSRPRRSEIVDARPGVRTYVVGGAGCTSSSTARSSTSPASTATRSRSWICPFSVQALAAHHLATASLPAGLHRFPDELDDLIARTKLETLGISLDAASDVQRRFKASWQ